MKKIVYAFMLMAGISVSGQVTIGTTANLSSTSPASSILEFDNASNRAIYIHPANLPSCSSVTAGGITFDNATGSVRFCNGTAWSTVISNGATGGTVPSGTDTGKVIIGSDTSAVDGVLVLESSSRALILPKLSLGQYKIASPQAGMIYYDTYTKKVTVYNGNRWTEM